MSSWRLLADCRDHPDPGLWFHEPGVPGAHQRSVQACHICSTCPVRTECLEDSLSDPRWLVAEIRGGLSARQRRHIKTQRNKNQS